MKLYNNILVLLLGLFLLNSCVDETIVKKGKEVIEGIPVTAKLSFVAEGVAEKVVTKGAVSTNAEYKVYDLYVFVFHSDGTFEKSFSFAYGDLQNVTEKNDDNNQATTGTISLDGIISENNKKIFAIANLFGAKAYEASKVFGELQSVDDLKELSAALTDKNAPVDRGSGRFLMSGSFAQNGKDVGSLTGGTVSIDVDGRPTTEGKIYLARMDSRIKFNVKVSEADGLKKTFTPKGYRVLNVPVTSYVFERNYSDNEGSTHDSAGDETSSPGDFYSDTEASKDDPYENFDQTLQDGEDNIIGGDFVFYMFENRKRALNKITDYNERERQQKDGSGKNGDYVNAHKYATYVEMIGSYYEQYLGDDGTLKEKTAEVKYTIHLGFLGDKADDFKSERNCSYTYNVTVKGVDNIELEVESSNDETPDDVIEKQPGAEGDVVKSDQFYFVDAHYTTHTIVFNKGNVSADASFRVKTPFDKDGRGDKAIDYKWVWFVQNSKEKSGGGSVNKYTYSEKKYKGLYDDKIKNVYPACRVLDLSYSALDDYDEGIKVPVSKETNFRVNATTIKWGVWSGWYYEKCGITQTSIQTKYTYNKDFTEFPSDNSKRLDIKTLIQKLKDDKNKDVDENSIYDSDGNAVFTVFVDEYYYDADPTGKTTGSPHWSKFVNKENREMHILCDTEYSKDEESSLTKSNFLISQKSIKTFYNDNASTGWGVESVNECAYASAKVDNKTYLNGRLPIEKQDVLMSESKDNGRYNMFKNIGYKADASWWNYIVSATNQLKKKDNVALLQQACLQRNRDLNGDGKIQHDEVRWYLPAINQMTGLFLGKDALPVDVQLLPNGETVTRDENDNYSNNYNYRDYHFTNSNNIQFWAEEGAATGSNEMNNGYWNYRCVRNLGINYNNHKEEPTQADEVIKYVSKETATGGVLLDLSNVNPKALRKTDDKGQELVIGDELSEYNRPYMSFIVKDQLTSKKITSESIYANTVVSPCPNGWRIPNMRELTLIQAFSGYSSTSMIFSNTKSSLSYKKDLGIVYNLNTKENITLSKDTKSAEVRCVKDKK
ncbi:DUF4906 domain-containing protein [Parabacteroides faecis]|uniref:fimbrial protein n=1 Tax=Parabacteroides TaxID=375288 RepID=UPI000EFDD8BB|nr:MULTISPECIES: DUF4906 domain-containing protein [Parabacteroides]MBC8616593.1 DUF4906 domain-containing protein [Parabacteroides faecis]RHR92647.1 DUF4906 domain-containing protein [Parabacteroides sp. AF14-59]